MKLLACPQCSRQYDVTNIAPLSKVRCICELVLIVQWKRPLEVAILQCAHCGGAVCETNDTCPYCDSALSPADRRETTLCPMCFVRMDDDSSFCRGCGVEIRPQALTPLPEGKSCPRCKGELRIRMIEDTDVVECADCAGMWLRPSVFKRVCNAAEQKANYSLFESAEDMRPERAPSSIIYIPCLQCDELMWQRLFNHRSRSSGVILDYCRKHGVWLDESEMSKILEFIHTHRDVGYGGPPVDAILDALGTAPVPSSHDADWSALGSGKRRPALTGMGTLDEAVDLIGRILGFLR